jgi:hypothetical protein
MSTSGGFFRVLAERFFVGDLLETGIAFGDLMFTAISN